MEAEMLSQPLLEHNNIADDEEAQQHQPERRMIFPSAATSLLDVPTNNGMDQETHTPGDNNAAPLIATSTTTIIPTNPPSVTPSDGSSTVTNNTNTILEMVPATGGQAETTITSTITTVSESTAPLPCAEPQESLDEDNEPSSSLSQRQLQQ
jgi:hypothetical protein